MVNDNLIIYVDTTVNSFSGSMMDWGNMGYTSVIVDDTTTYTPSDWQDNYLQYIDVDATYKIEYVFSSTPLTTIPQRCFVNGDCLTRVDIPSTVTTIGDSAFEWCENLLRVYFYSTTPPTIDEHTFYSINSDCKFYVPIGTIPTYSSAQYYPSSSRKYEEISSPMPTTLNGALELLGETMADNLTTMGLIGVDASDGLTTLANDILLIQGGGGSDCTQYQTQIANAIEYINGDGS